MRSGSLNLDGGKQRTAAVNSSAAVTTGCFVAAFLISMSSSVFAMGGGGDGPFDQLMIELMYRDHPELLQRQRNDNSHPTPAPRVPPRGDGPWTDAQKTPLTCCAHSWTNGTAYERKEKGE